MESMWSKFWMFWYCLNARLSKAWTLQRGCLVISRVTLLLICNVDFAWSTSFKPTQYIHELIQYIGAWGQTSCAQFETLPWRNAIHYHLTRVTQAGHSVLCAPDLLQERGSPFAHSWLMSTKKIWRNLKIGYVSMQGIPMFNQGNNNNLWDGWTIQRENCDIF